jgi:glucosamine-6-phosphate deaminase
MTNDAATKPATVPDVTRSDATTPSATVATAAVPPGTQAVAEATVDRLRVRAYADRKALGEAAGADVAAAVRRLQAAKPMLRMVFAAAPSQNETLAALIRAPGIDWSRVTAFHMDEYVGLPANAPQAFGQFLLDRLFDRVRPAVVHLIDGNNDPAAECRRYSDLLRAGPIDVVCLGIGENGHLAFNDPPVADFDDPAAIKMVELETACRRQQVNDGCFASLADVPTHALTLTIPTLMSGAELFCAVPGPTKRAAVARTLAGPVSTDCPSSVLRRHPNCTLYVDRASYGG